MRRKAGREKGPSPAQSSPANSPRGRRTCPGTSRRRTSPRPGRGSGGGLKGEREGGGLRGGVSRIGRACAGERRRPPRARIPIGLICIVLASSPVPLCMPTGRAEVRGPIAPARGRAHTPLVNPLSPPSTPSLSVLPAWESTNRVTGMWDRKKARATRLMGRAERGRGGMVCVCGGAGWGGRLGTGSVRREPARAAATSGERGVVCHTTASVTHSSRSARALWHTVRASPF
jgi:hypothetical protein